MRGARNKQVRNFDDYFLRWIVRCCDKQSCRARGNALPSALLLSFICALLAGIMTFGCATPHASFQFTAPAKATAGVPFTVTVTTLYEGKPDTVINSGIHFTSSDPNAVLPGDYYFTPSDAGLHTFVNAFVLRTPGNQTISGSIHLVPGINGSATILVSR